jgi:hypothetical protein
MSAKFHEPETQKDRPGNSPFGSLYFPLARRDGLESEERDEHERRCQGDIAECGGMCPDRSGHGVWTKRLEAADQKQTDEGDLQDRDVSHD